MSALSTMDKYSRSMVDVKEFVATGAVDGEPASDKAGRMSNIHFARSGDVHVAYKTVGEGQVDLVFVQGAFSHLEVEWELPAFRSFCERIGEFARLILFDKRGMGLSDRVPGATSLEERMDDIRAVMDAAGSEQAVIMGASEGGPLALLFAAAHPERVASLILMGAEVRERKDEEWPWGESTPEEFEAAMARIDEVWGQGRAIAWLAPSVADQPWAQEWVARQQLNSCTPGAAEAFMRMAFDIDVRDVVPTVRVPTLVLHNQGDLMCHVENGRFLAQTLPEARYVELPGSDHVPWFDPEATLAEIQRFVTGSSGPMVRDRVLTTVLFVDIVGSTDRASDMGDHAWLSLLETYNDMVSSSLDEYRGVKVSSAGDGFLATFDGPARAIRCAQTIAAKARDLGLETRAGVHTGEVELAGDDIAGITVHIGSRLEAMAQPSEVLVSGTVRALVAGSGIDFEERGSHELKGVPGRWEVAAPI
jgi:class 3 adenylate cyclase